MAIVVIAGGWFSCTGKNRNEGKNYSFYYNKHTKQTLLIAMEDDGFSFPLGTYENEFVSIKYKEDTGAPILIFYTVNFDL